jgi:hypothetical protein
MSLKSKLGAGLVFACRPIDGAPVATTIYVEAAEEREDTPRSTVRDSGLELTETD